MTITALPAYPVRSMVEEIFVNTAENWMAALGTWTNEVNAAGVATALSESNAAASASAASGSASAASASANAASLSAANAANSAGATLFNASTNYAAGGAAISGLNFQLYRRKTAGTSATDPMNDPTNWVPNMTAVSLITAAGTLTEGNHIFAKDVNVSLPDLSTFKQISLTYPSNFPATPTGTITTQDGWTINPGYAANTVKQIVPQAQTGTPHGWWGSLVMTPPLNATASGMGSTGVTYFGSVILSSTCHIYAFCDQTNQAYYVIAINPLTGAVGTPVLVPPVGSTNAHLVAISSTSFAIIAYDTVTAGVVTGLSISLGSGVSLGNSVFEPPIQLTATTFLVHTNATTNNLVVVSVSGSTCTLGTAVTSGMAASQRFTMAPISATAALLAYLSTASGAAIMNFRVVSISGTTITLNTVYPAATAVCTGDICLMAMTSSSFIACSTNNSVSTSGSWYGVTVSGTVVTVGTVNVQALVNWLQYKRSTHIYRCLAANYGNSYSLLKGYALDSTRLLASTQNNTLVVVSISGTTLTFGSTYSLSTTPLIFTDIATGSNVYTNSTTSLIKLSISGTTISAAYTIATASAVAAVFTDTVNDRAANYGGTWYTWTAGLPACYLPISSTKYANLSTTILKIYGNFS